MKLGEYLSRPLPAWDWQALDCCRWVDGWIQTRGHESPMAAIGIRYDSERSALRRIAEGGGLPSLWSAAMQRIGVGVADSPLPGNVGIIRRATACGMDEAAGIWTGQRWVTLGLRGLDFGPAEPLAMWRV